jgi:hypothetical protein
MKTLTIITLLAVSAFFALDSIGAERGSVFPNTGTKTRQQPSTQSTTATPAMRPNVINTQQLTITGSSTDAKAFSPVKLTTQQLTITGSNPDAKFTPANITTQQLTITGPPRR